MVLFYIFLLFFPLNSLAADHYFYKEIVFKVDKTKIGETVDMLVPILSSKGKIVVYPSTGRIVVSDDEKNVKKAEIRVKGRKKVAKIQLWLLEAYKSVESDVLDKLPTSLPKAVVDKLTSILSFKHYFLKAYAEIFVRHNRKEFIVLGNYSVDFTPFVNRIRKEVTFKPFMVIDGKKKFWKSQLSLELGVPVVVMPPSEKLAYGGGKYQLIVFLYTDS